MISASGASERLNSERLACLARELPENGCEMGPRVELCCGDLDDGVCVCVSCVGRLTAHWPVGCEGDLSLWSSV